MPELLVIGYETPAAAEAARAEVLGMAKEYLVDVTDAVVATVDDDGGIRLAQMVDLWAVGATGGAFWGLLAGILFFNPLLGLVIGATAGAVSGALADYGIDDAFMRKVSALLQPGHAALFLLLKTPASERMVTRLGAKGGEILRTNLDPAAETALRDAFATARDGLGKTLQGAERA
ncbi:DUF1269 domain-containing protein (plasmid) [Rhodobacter capsulatus]|uniref:DUF1269 domain-containing protein n=1 Tax=Rhodobacter capsulatus TaxID=1061 RepID=UPI00114215F2|nr:DUF1269 domain-containing protein [Rhodobacter capsulatus]TQD33316.1 DUF1269 domain-containing protein [Rhodobacter capsulatus]